MSWRTVIISSQAKLDFKMGYMVVRSDETKRVFLDEIAVLIIENPAVAITGCLIEALIEKKIKVIFCNSKRNPEAELVPHHPSHDSSSKIKRQIAWEESSKAKVWQEIVKDKIRKQAEFLILREKEKEAELLVSYITEVEPMDPTNREGLAAKVYFRALFGAGFIRGADDSLNSALNYGYSLILSAFNREIASNGYLTQLGICHDSMFNHFNLGSDLMEPFRIIVDRAVCALDSDVFDVNTKHSLCTILEQPLFVDSSKQTVLNAIKIYTKSVFDAIESGNTSLIKFYSYNA